MSIKHAHKIESFVAPIIVISAINIIQKWLTIIIW